MAQAAARPLNRQDVKTLGLSALGGALEFYDFIIFVFFAPIIGELFFPADMPEWLRTLETFGLFAAGYLARPLGGIVLAHFGDLLGRKRMFALSIFLMSVPTLLMGLMPTWASWGVAAPVVLLLLRVLQGAAIGGEVPGAWVFVSEHVPEHRVGFACGTLTAGLTAGILLGSLVATGMTAAFTKVELHDWAWRMPFILGGVFGLVSVYLRRWLHETPIFTEMQARKTLSAELPLRRVVREHRRAIGASMLLTWVLSAGIVVVILMTPTLLQKPPFGVAPKDALLAGSIAVVCLTVGCIVAGWAVDRFGEGQAVAGGSLLMGIVASAFFYVARTNPETLIPAYALAGFCVGAIGTFPAVMVRAFAPDVRFSGLSFSYNVSYAICGGLTPVIVSLLSKAHPMGPAAYVGLVALLGAGIGVWLFVKGEGAFPTAKANAPVGVE